jgi:hypothetical protein
MLINNDEKSEKKFTEKEIDDVCFYLSNNRLETYRKLYGKLDNHDILEKYKLNIEVSKSYYEILCYFEIFFRNAIDCRLTEVFGEKWFEIIKFNEKDKNRINSAKRDVLIKKRFYTKNDIISNLNLGFWVYMFNSDYETKLWNNVLNKIFPHKTSREKLYCKLKQIKNVRNRVSHYEIIINDYATRSDALQSIVEILNWINPTLARWVSPHISALLTM